MLRRLADATTEWERNEREPSYMLRGSRLDQFETWAEGTDLAVGRVDLGFLRASTIAREEERAVETARRDHERALERRSVKRLRGLVAVLAVAALVAGTLTVIARNQSDRAGRESRIATARQLAAAAEANLEQDPERAILLAIEAIETTRSVDGSVLPEAESALHHAVMTSRIVLSVPGVGGELDWSPKGVFVTEGLEDSGVIDIRDATTGDRVRAFPGHDPDVNDVGFSPDGSMLATAGDDGALKVWNPATGESTWTFETHGQVWHPSFNGDGSLTAAAWADEGKVRVFDTSDGRVVGTFTGLGWVNDTALSPDGRMLAVLPYPDLTVFDLETGTIAFKIEGDGFNEAEWAPDGLRLATAKSDGTVQLWDGGTGDLVLTVSAHRAAIFGLDWSADGSRLLTAGDDGTAKVWEVTERGANELISLSAQDTRGGIYGAAFSPDGTQVMTGDGDIVSTKIWDVTVDGDAEWVNLPARPSGDPRWVNVEFLPDGRRLASTDEEHRIALWELTTGRKLRTFRVSGSPITSFDVTDDGTAIAATQGDRYVTAWDIDTGEVIFRFDCECAWLSDVDWSPGGGHLLAAGNFGTVLIFDDTGRFVRRLDEEGNVRLESARFSPDGRFVLTSLFPNRGGPQTHRQTIWDWERGKVVDAIAPGDGSNGAIVAVFDPTGSRIATAGANGVPRIWNVETGRTLVALGGHVAAPWDITFSPDGSRVATAGADGTVRVFDSATGEMALALQAHERTVGGVAFSPDGTMLASESMDGTIRIWVLELDDLIEIARQEVTRSLTDEECRQYLHLEACA
jgi:WD40 repeat protein